MNRPRVLIISGSASDAICGVTDYTSRLIAELRRQRPEWDWLWLCRRSRWFHSPYVKAGGTRIIRPHHAWDSVGKALATRAERMLRPDLVHITDEIFAFHETDAAVVLAEAAGCPVITTLTEFHSELPSFRHTVALVERSRAIIASDTRTFERCSLVAGRTPDLLAWCPSNLIPSPTYAREPAPKFLITFGHINELKLLDIAFEAIRLLHPEERGLRWLIVGQFDPVTNRRHRDLQEKLRAPWVTFTGALKESEIENLFRKTAVMLLPFADGASVRRGTLQAAWAFGLPVVTTAPGANEPAIRDDGNCLFAEINSPKSWADAIARVIDDPVLATRLSDEGFKTADSFSWDRLAKLHLNIYDRILDSKHDRKADRDARSTAAVQQ